MPILGLGQFPCGLAPAGTWLEEPEETPAEERGERFLDPVTRDYALAPDGTILRGSAAKQRMVIAVMTRAGTSLAVRGVKFPPTHDQNTARLTEAEVREAVRPQVDDGTVRIDRIHVETEADRRGGRLGIEIQFTNLGTGEQEELTL